MGRESNQRDLYESIEKGQYPRWTMYVQTMTVEQAEALTDFNPFDLGGTGPSRWTRTGHAGWTRGPRR